MKKVFVVTGLEFGWDCVCGVFDQADVTMEELEAIYPERAYVISDRTLDTREDMLDMLAEREDDLQQTVSD
jgi:hypothetical protein